MPKSDVITGTRVLSPGTGGSDLLDRARIDGQLYAVGLYFKGAAPKLSKIQLHAEIATKMDQGRCRDFFEKIAGEVKEKYGEMQGNTAKVPLIGQVVAYTKKFGDESTLTISEIFSDRCDVNVTYEAPPLQPIEASF
jgi:hypothetical protein